MMALFRQAEYRALRAELRELLARQTFSVLTVPLYDGYLDDLKVQLCNHEEAIAERWWGGES